MQLYLNITGVILIALALLHFYFPKHFNWRTELSSLSLINRELMYVHSFFIALVVFLIGLLCLTSATELLNTVLGKRVSLGLAIFWGIRLAIQFVGYSTKNWKGKSFETGIHILLSILWIWLTAIFILTYLY
ncbi:MAG: hypothetical protein KBF82_14465 [Chitinophagaceae bacterium]|nr:hypothetical protein [Chitinophagaceae bacterium]